MADEIDWLDLPGRWTYGVDRGGRIFFINDEEKSTSWLHPGTGSPIQSGHSAGPGLPKGWEMDSAPEGAVYFIKSQFPACSSTSSPCYKFNGKIQPGLLWTPQLLELSIHAVRHHRAASCGTVFWRLTSPKHNGALQKYFTEMKMCITIFNQSG